MAKLDTFDLFSPLDYRYCGDDDEEIFLKLSPYLSEAAYIRCLLRVEVAIMKALAERGVCDISLAEEVERAVEKISPAEVYEEERRIKHNIRALANCIKKRVSEETGRYIHLFATSCDILDTATSLRFKELAENVILPDLKRLLMTMIEISKKHKDTLQIGRTHGQHAVPITFGFYMANFIDRIGKRYLKIRESKDHLTGLYSGAVGAFNAASLKFPDDPEKLEEIMLEELKLYKPDVNISSQIIHPEPLLDLTYAVSSCFSILANIADDFRHLYRTEIGEITEAYKKDDVGSSTMPHKINPRDFENIKSLWKEFMPRMNTLFMDQISEHQRDLTNSASSRFTGEIFAAFVYSVNRLNKSLRKLMVDKERMLRNLDMSKDSIVAEPLYILLALAGHPLAYDETRTLMEEAKGKNMNIMDVALQRSDIKKYFDTITDDQREILKDPSRYTGIASKLCEKVCKYWEELMAK